MSRQLFRPFIKYPEDILHCGTYLLACATTRRSMGRRGEEGFDHKKNTNMVIARENEHLVLEVQKALLKSLKICNSEETISISGLHRDSPGMQTLLKLLKKHPPVSAGVLLWIYLLFISY